MIAALLLALVQAAVPAPAAIPAPLLGAIGPQTLPAKGCAAFLWSAGGDRRLVAMAVADPATIRLSIDGKNRDIARIAITDQGSLGFGGSTVYAGDGLTATLDMQVVSNANLTDGAQVPGGALRIDRAGRDTLVVPVAGLIGCTS